MNEIILGIILIITMAFLYRMFSKANNPVKLPAYQPSGYTQINLNDYKLSIILINTTEDYVHAKVNEYKEITEIDDGNEPTLKRQTDNIIYSEDDLLKNNFFNLVLWLEGKDGEPEKPELSLGIAESGKEAESFYCIPDNFNKNENIVTGEFSGGKKFFIDLDSDRTNNTELIISERINLETKNYKEVVNSIKNSGL